ncbi:MAG: AAA family ATPase, partial [Muribaculaceae bacterium]|nr:AAA family ATPase [Muribaculaceae bacterium]
MGKSVGYPIGEQDFKSLRNMECVYVDKTSFIMKILQQRSKYLFLARPRRFGKSLFLSTLRYFFEGERKLFRGLDIDRYDWNWEKYPVLYLDLNTDRYSESKGLDEVLDNLFRKWEMTYDVKPTTDDLPQRFKSIISAAHEKTGKQVVILVDEYDKPLVGNLNEEQNFNYYRSKLASIYSNFKSSAEDIRLVFITGVS